MRQRFGIEVTIPVAPPKVAVELGDLLVVMSVRGLPRRTAETGSEYTQEEVDGAKFVFSIWNIE